MKYFYLIALCLSYSQANSQNNSDSIPITTSTPDSTTTETVRYNFIIIDSRYQSQFAFWGRNYGQRIPLVASNVMHYFNSGVWVGVSNFSFFDSNIPTQFGGTLGYFKEVNPRVDWHFSYSQFYVPSNLIPAEYKTQGYAQSTIGFDWGPLFSTIQIHGLLNKNSDIFFTTSHSRYFQFNRPLWKKIKVSFEPKFSFTLGTHRFEYANALIIAPGGGGVISTSGTENNPGKKIQMLNWDFRFPLKFEVGYFSFEPSWKLTAPLNANPDFSSRMQQIINVDLNYTLPIKR